MDNRPICIYSMNSIDDFATAWVVWKKFKNDSLYNGDILPLEKYRGRDIIITNFDFDFNIEDLLKISRSVEIIGNTEVSDGILEKYNLPGISNINKTKSILAWKYFHNSEVPLFLEYIYDRCFNKFELPHSKEVNYAILSYELTFANYDEIYETFIDDLVIEGKAIVRLLKKSLGRDKLGQVFDF